MRVNIRKLRTERGISKLRAAQAMGVSRPTYDKLEAHPELATVEQLNGLYALMRCTKKDFFSGDD